MELHVTLEGAEDLRARLDALGTHTPRVVARALNRAGATARTAVARALAEWTALAQKDIRPSLVVERATVSRQAATLTVRARWIALIKFLGRSGYRSGRGIGGLAYRLGRVPGDAFFATMPRTGHRGVFRRTSPTRTPIREIPGPPLSDVVVRERIFEAVSARVAEVLRARLEHEIQFLADRGALAAGGD